MKKKSYDVYNLMKLKVFLAIDILYKANSIKIAKLIKKDPDVVTKKMYHLSRIKNVVKKIDEFNEDSCCYYYQLPATMKPKMEAMIQQFKDGVDLHINRSGHYKVNYKIEDIELIAELLEKRNKK
jgi:uridine kinase